MGNSHRSSACWSGDGVLEKGTKEGPILSILVVYPLRAVWSLRSRNLAPWPALGCGRRSGVREWPAHRRKNTSRHELCCYRWWHRRTARRSLGKEFRTSGELFIVDWTLCYVGLLNDWGRKADRAADCQHQRAGRPVVACERWTTPQKSRRGGGSAGTMTVPGELAV